MPMTSEEVVKSAVHFEGPDRLPVFFDSLGVTDGATVRWNQIGTGERTLYESVDEWGCTWGRTSVSNMGQVKGHPLIDNGAWDSFPWLDGDEATFFEGVEDRFEGTEGRYVLTGIFMLLFERMHSLCGFEKVLMDLMLDRPRMETLADRIVEFDLKVIENMRRIGAGRIHGFNFSDDWGTERQLFIQPELWREFFKPRYKRIFDACHDAGWDVWMHSCGKVNAIIGDLIEIGLNVINLQQPRALGIEKIGQDYAGKICFSSLCDIQHTLPFESADTIRNEAKQLLDCWGTDAGGFLLCDYGDGEAIGVPDEKKQVMYDAFMTHDRWRRSA